MNKIYGKPDALKDVQHLYCGGCGHGITHRLVAEVIDELCVREKVIAVAPVGCAVFAYEYFNFDVTEAPHGRPPAVATGIKRTNPDKVVFTYQGDGDLAAIGTAETVHAANRGENITVIFVNNGIYGMTGGQMAPTTLIGQKSVTSPFGRDANRDGFPLKVCELLQSLSGVTYLERVAVNNPKNILAAKRAIKKAFEIQISGKGFSLVEVLSQCPVNWGMTPAESVKWIDETFMKYYPLGIYKDNSKVIEYK